MARLLRKSIRLQSAGRAPSMFLFVDSTRTSLWRGFTVLSCNVPSHQFKDTSPLYNLSTPQVTSSINQGLVLIQTTEVGPKSIRNN
jgi:hypothetical protein